MLYKLHLAPGIPQPQEELAVEAVQYFNSADQREVLFKAATTGRVNTDNELMYTHADIDHFSTDTNSPALAHIDSMSLHHKDCTTPDHSESTSPAPVNPIAPNQLDHTYLNHIDPYFDHLDSNSNDFTPACSSDEACTTNFDIKPFNVTSNSKLLNQEQFIDLCKSMYNLFREDEKEQDLYQAIASVASLLLRLGEVGRKLEHGNRDPMPDVNNALASICIGSQKESPEKHPNSGYTGTRDDVNTGAWMISFEQFVASVLTEPLLCDFFDRKYDLDTEIVTLKHTLLERPK
uniref:Uncharacterized protein n=1 Tax=Ciona savignyi TaxID=51511 RepID=H2YF38_CIOSA